jgi:hypothetical protein
MVGNLIGSSFRLLGFLGFVETIVKEKMYFLGFEYKRGYSKGKIVALYIFLSISFDFPTCK